MRGRFSRAGGCQICYVPPVPASMTTGKKLSFVFFACLAAGVVWLHLGQVVLAGFFSYMILDLADRRLRRVLPELAARAAAVAVFVVIAALVSWLLWAFIRLALVRLPAILETLIPRVDQLARERGL